MRFDLSALALARRLSALGLLLHLLQAPVLAQLQPPIVPPGNPITEPKRVLGKALFWDEQLSSDDTIACGTCHFPGRGGSDPRSGTGTVHPGPDGLLGTPDDRRNSPGVRATDPGGTFRPDPVFGFEPQVTPRRAPSTLMAAHVPQLFWDGRAMGHFVDPETGRVSLPGAAALESLCVEPVLSEVEMADAGRTWDEVRAKLGRVRPLALAFDLPRDLEGPAGSTYPELFAAAFGDPAITAERIAFSLATYLRTLSPDQTPWDRYVAGDPTAMTPEQIAGWQAIQTQSAACLTCHTPPIFTDASFRNLGLRPSVEDPGRETVTGNPSDRGAFKMPSLRGAAERGIFFHTGAPDITNLIELVEFYAAGGGPFEEDRDPLLATISLTPEEVRSIVAFLEGALTDPRAAAERPPFDRPRLNSERPRPGPVEIVGGHPGSAGLVPRIVGSSPVHHGAVGFHLGVAGGLGGADALLLLALQPPPGAAPFRKWSPRLLPFTLAGSGAGAGYATFVGDLPAIPALAGARFLAQWRIDDPGAAGGQARSPLVAGILF